MNNMNNKNDLIIFDTETTGLPLSDIMPVNKQPQIIEFAAVKVDFETLKIKERIEFMCNPGCPLPAHITKITGITDRDLHGKMPFPAFYKELCEFFLGARNICAHNLAFDISMLKYELMRIDRLLQFPWPHNHLCTVELSFSLYKKRLHLSELHKLATGKEFAGAHRAMVDVEALLRCVRWLREKAIV